MLEILAHSGPARLGVWHFEDKKIPTPNFLLNLTPSSSRIRHEVYIAPHWLRTKKKPLIVHYGTIAGGAKVGRYGILPSACFGFDIPKGLAEEGVKKSLEIAERYPEHGAVVEGGKYPELRERAAQILKKRSLICIANGARLCRNPRLLVEVVTRVREAIHPNTPLYFPGSPPSLFPVLTYMGIDLMDASYAIEAASLGRYLTAGGEYEVSRLRELPCQCSACSGGVEKLRDLKLLTKHNIAVLRSLLAEIRESIRAGKFENLLEMSANASAQAKAALRILYREKYEFLEKYTPIAP